MAKKFNNGNGAYICDTCGIMLTSGAVVLHDFVLYQDGQHFCDNGREGCDQGSRDVGQRRIKK